MKQATFKCSSHCLRFTAYKICPHTVAVAETVKDLGNMLANFNRYNKVSISKLANVDHSKESEATQRRKGVACKPYRTTTAFGNAESLKDTKLPQIHASQKLPEQEKLDDHHYQGAVVDRVPLLDPVPGSYILTLLNFCHDKTSKFYGCSGALKEGSAIPPPPRDLVIVSKARRQFISTNKSLCSGKLRNVYYQFNVEYVERKKDYSVLFLCQLQSGIANRLLPVHKSVLMSAGIHH